MGRLTIAEKLALRREHTPNAALICGEGTLRWMHLVEEMHRFRGGRWQACPYRHS